MHGGEQVAKGNNIEMVDRGPPDPSDHEAFRRWLGWQRREWSVAIAGRTALRALPLLRTYRGNTDVILSVFRAAAIARFAGKYPRANPAASYAHPHAADRADAKAARAAADAAAAYSDAEPAARAASAAARAAGAAAATATGDATAAANAAAAATAGTAAAATVEAAPDARAAVLDEFRNDVEQLHRKALTSIQLMTAPLWKALPPPRIGGSWQGFAQELRAHGAHWSVWVDWYDDVLNGAAEGREDYHAAFTDLPGELPWGDGAKAVNTEIARRLAEIDLSEPAIPDQSPAPVRIEERNGRISQRSDRDSALSAAERDFWDWRDPVLDHIGELTNSDFAVGTNHARLRDRLMALQGLLPGEIPWVMERQFRIGYEIERLDGLLIAYRNGGEDMPELNAVQLEDLTRLNVALRMGIDKFERWADFRKQASESKAGEGNADHGVVADVLEDMAASMEQQAQYFQPELPASFRFLAEAVRDPLGATKTVVYGAVKSAENLMSFLGQRALAIGKKVTDAVEAHISKAIAASLIAGFSTAAVMLSGALPQGWVWLKPLLAALGLG
jgi:hypothetical protein